MVTQSIMTRFEFREHDELLMLGYKNLSIGVLELVVWDAKGDGRLYTKTK